MTALQSFILDGVCQVDPVASMSLDADRIRGVMAAISAVSSVAALCTRVQPGAVDVSTSASLDIDGDMILDAIATVSSSMWMLADADAYLSAVAILSTAATMAAAGNRVAIGEVSVAASAALSALGINLINGEVSISATSSVAAAALLYIAFELGYTGTLGAGDVLIIDTDEQTVTLNGANATRYFTGDFWHLFDGTNEIRWADDDAARTVEMKFEHKPRWL